MNKEKIIANTRKFVKEKLEGEGTGHDYFHVERVVKLSLLISEKERQGDKFIIEIAALLHDIADWKFNNADEEIGSKITRNFLEKENLDEKILNEIEFIVKNISFKGGTNKIKQRTIEGKIVQDADRLDALGAIGIGRTFAYGGFKGREMHNPKIKPKKYKNLKSYASSKNTTLNHFYEKLFLLKDGMNTKTAKSIAENREMLMKNFVQEFLNEWRVKI